MRSRSASMPRSSKGRIERQVRSEPLRRAVAYVLEALEERRLFAFDFGYAGNFGPGAFRAPGDFALGDINGDGMNDAVYTESQGNFTTHIGIRLGDGQGHFGAASEVDSGGNKGAIRLGDVNRDGKLDMVYTGVDDGTLRTRFGNGDGTFGPEAIRAQLAPTISPSSLLTGLELADFNNDGVLDAVGSSVNAGIRVAYDDGTGTFNAAGVQYDGAGGVNNMVVLDASGDGRPDVVYASRSGPDLAVLSNIGLGNPLRSSVTFDPQLDVNTNVAAAKVGNSVVFALIESEFGKTGRVVVGRNPGDAPKDVNFISGFAGASVPTIADFDNDGLPDLAFAVTLTPETGTTGTIHLYKGFAQNTPFQGSPTLITGGVSLVSVAAADVNQDGNPDMVVEQVGRNAPYDDFNVYISNQQSLVVSTTADENDGNARWNSGAGNSLREAMAYANSIPGTRSITFAPFLGNANAVVNLTNGPLLTRGVGEVNFTIANTRGHITISGNNTASPIVVSGSSTLTIRNVTLTNFRASSAFGNDGGALWVDFDGRLNLDGVTVTNSTATGRGGALFADQLSQVNIRNSTFTNNGGDGALAFRADSGAVVTLENNTIAGNLNNGIRLIAGAITLRNNIIANNNGSDIAITAGGLAGTNNIIRTGSTGGLSNTINADPLLNALADNGGFTQTMSFRGGSAAYNAGVTIAAITTDQRGVARPQNGAYDIGAYEAVQAPPVAGSVTVAVRNSSDTIREGDTVTIFVDISNIRDQYGSAFKPSGGSVKLTVGGVDQPVQSISQEQFNLGSFICQFTLAIPDDNPSGTSADVAPVVATVTLDALVVTKNASINVNNAPVESVQASTPQRVNQGESFNVSGSFYDAGTQDPHTVTIDWKDGTPNSVLNLAAGVLNFSTSHTYAT